MSVVIKVASLTSIIFVPYMTFTILLGVSWIKPGEEEERVVELGEGHFLLPNKRDRKKWSWWLLVLFPSKSFGCCSWLNVKRASRFAIHTTHFLFKDLKKEQCRHEGGASASWFVILILLTHWRSQYSIWPTEEGRCSRSKFNRTAIRTIKPLQRSDENLSILYVRARRPRPLINYSVYVQNHYPVLECSKI